MAQKPSRLTTVVVVVAILLSAYNTFLIFNSSNVWNAEIDELRSESAEAEGRIAELESMLGNISSDLDALAEIQEGLETVSSELTSITEMIDSSTGDIEGIRSDLEAVTGKVSEISGDLSALNTSISGLEEAVEGTVGVSPASVYESSRKSVVIIRAETKQGSGFMWRNETYILTNWHVVNETSEVTVEFYDGTRRPATVLGLDAYSDVAVLTVTGAPEEAVPLTLGNSTEIYIGQQVVAIGNPLGYSGSLSSGFISQVNEKIDLPPLIVPVLQLDVTIAPGSSGGPLLDLHGNVLGITNAGTFYGFNFAVPANIARRVANSILDVGYYRHPLVGFWGMILTPEVVEDMNLANVDPYQYGILVLEVMAGYPAEEAGLQAAEETTDSEGNPGYIARDIIVAVDNIQIRTWGDWDVYFAEQVSPDQTIQLTLWRSGEEAEVDLVTTFREPYER